MAFDRIVAGLGNPGTKYEGTRHNAGAEFIARLSAHSGIALAKSRHGSRTGEGILCRQKVLLALPRTYMNLSGQPIRTLLSFSGTPASSLVVVHDDMDLPCGRIRLRLGGGAGGHNGIRSIIQHLQTGDFLRLKIGIGRPPEGVPAEKFVLQTFSASDRVVFEESLGRALAALESVLTDGLERAMSLFNSAPDA